MQIEAKRRLIIAAPNQRKTPHKEPDRWFIGVPSWIRFAPLRHFTHDNSPVAHSLRSYRHVVCAPPSRRFANN